LITSQVTLATFTICSPDPDFSFAASNNWTAAGGVLQQNQMICLYTQ
jgi:hypothetical protein